jgi:hemerythrin
MPILEWKDSFTLGIEQFDLHHRHMVDLLNRAHDTYHADGDLQTLSATLNELFDYAMYHFQVEEQFMEENNYAGFAEHLEYHKNFSSQVAAMQHDLTQVWKNLPLEMLTFLKNWLTYDIGVADTEYIRVIGGGHWKKCA